MTHRLKIASKLGAGALAALTLWFAAGGALAHDYTIGDLHIVHPWARATLGGADVAGGYLVIENKGTSPDRLTGASADVSKIIEIHEMKTEDGIMKMRQLKEGLELKPGAKTEFRPGSYHIMFIGLKGPLKQGDTFKASLTFEKAGTIDVNFMIDAPGAKTSQDHAH